MRLSKFETKAYMIFASDKKEVIKILEQIEIKNNADRDDIKTLAYLGLPIWCCISIDKFQSRSIMEIPFIILDRELEKFANQPKFDWLRNKYYKNFERQEAKKRIVQGLIEFFNFKKYLKK